ncbi:MAG TPA: EamA family transporter [Candidatus Limnocylindrales bacterium]
MIAILGGLGAAVLWATATLTSSRAGRLIGPSSTVAWMMAVGLLVATPLALASGPIPAMTPNLVLWMAGSGLGGVIGLLLVYRGLSLGKVGVVAALASTEGAIAAVVSVIAGESMTIPVAALLCVIAGGIAVVAFLNGTADAAATGAADVADAGEAAAGAKEIRVASERQAVLCGAAAAICFGVSIYSTAKVGASLSPIAAVLPVRVVGVVAVFVPLLLSGRLRITRRSVPMVLLIGVAEVFGNAAYVVGAQDSIAIAAVLASQFAVVTAIAAFVIFGERLSLYQRSGVAVIAMGVALLTLVRV